MSIEGPYKEVGFGILRCTLKPLNQSQVAGRVGGQRQDPVTGLVLSLGFRVLSTFAWLGYPVLVPFGFFGVSSLQAEY